MEWCQSRAGPGGGMPFKVFPDLLGNRYPTHLLMHFRDSSAKITYKLVSASPHSNRHMVSIFWSKAQEGFAAPKIPYIESASQPLQFVFKMTSVATPDSKQSEAYIATVALFSIFSSTKEDKVSMRLPAAFRDLWSEFAEGKKAQEDSADRDAIRELRAMVRQRQDRELEDGVLLQGAFRGRGSKANANDTGSEPGHERGGRNTLEPEHYQRIWADKESRPKFQSMLVCNHDFLLRCIPTDFSPAIPNATPNVAFQRAGTCRR